MTEKVDRPALAAALLSVLPWASAFVGIRAVAPDLSSGSLALGRLVIGSVALGVLVALRPWQRPLPRDLVLIGTADLLWFATYNLALNTAEHSFDAGTAAMLVSQRAKIAPSWLRIRAVAPHTERPSTAYAP